MLNNRTWWEKTVEYFFLAEYLSRNYRISPLDGNLERDSGDALVNSKGKFVLIEFKRDEASIASEVRKFKGEKGYHDIRQELLLEKAVPPRSDAHHLLIFGKDVEGLELCCKTYFLWQHKPIEGSLESGICYKEFRKYLDWLRDIRSGTGTGGGGASMFYSNSISDVFLSVVFIVHEGNRVTPMTIREFQLLSYPHSTSGQSTKLSQIFGITEDGDCDENDGLKNPIAH